MAQTTQSNRVTMNGIDGSDAPQSRPTPPPLYTKLKAQLNDVLLTIDALDKASLAMLKHDTDYRHTIQRLLAPLTATPLSELVEETMKSGLEAISSKISTFIPLPAPISQTPKGPASGPSPWAASVKKPPPPASAPILEPIVSPRTTIATRAEARMQQVEGLVKGVKVRSREALQQLLDKSQGDLVLVWLLLFQGRWEETFNTKQLVQEINHAINFEFSVAPPGQPSTISPCIDAWMSADRRRIVLFIRPPAQGIAILMIRKMQSRIVPNSDAMPGSWLSIVPTNQIQPGSSFL